VFFFPARGGAGALRPSAREAQSLGNYFMHFNLLAWRTRGFLHAVSKGK